MDAWEKRDSITGLLREIEILEGRRKKLNQQGYKINYNTTQGQKQSAKLTQDIEDINNQINVYYEELNKLNTEEYINVTFTADIQRDGRIQIPSGIRNKKNLNRGDVLEITINKKL